MLRLLLLILLLIAPGAVAQDDDLPTIDTGDTVTGDLSEGHAYTITLDEAESINIEVETEAADAVRIAPGRTNSSYRYDGHIYLEFNAPEDGTYTIELMVENPDEDSDDRLIPPSEGTYTLTASSIESEMISVDVPHVIPAGTPTPRYLLFEGEADDLLRVQAVGDGSEPTLRLEDASGFIFIDPMRWPANTMYFYGDEIDVLLPETGIYRIVLGEYGGTADVLDAETTVSITPLEPRRGEIEVGGVVEDESYTLTEYDLELDPYQTVIIRHVSDFDAQIHLLDSSGELRLTSGHTSSGGILSRSEYTATVAGTYTVRILAPINVTAAGNYTITVEERETVPLAQLPATFDLEEREEVLLTADLDPDTDYRLRLSSPVDATAPVDVRMRGFENDVRFSFTLLNLQEIVYGFESGVGGRAHIRLSAREGASDLSIELYAVEE